MENELDLIASAISVKADVIRGDIGITYDSACDCASVSKIKEYPTIIKEYPTTIKEVFPDKLKINKKKFKLNFKL